MKFEKFLMFKMMMKYIKRIILFKTILKIPIRSKVIAVGLLHIAIFL